jgi:type II secretory ATPase GspE/PulE/Tfp pilus assembly ATPase PilB-like protein
MNEKIRELIANNASSLEIRTQAIQDGYRPLVVDGINKVLNGITTLDELNNQLAIF